MLDMNKLYVPISTCFEDTGDVTEVSITEKILNERKNEEWLYELA